MSDEKSKENDSRITAELIPLTEEELRQAAMEILKEAEKKLGDLGDQLHELRHQVEGIRARFEATK